MLTECTTALWAVYGYLFKYTLCVPTNTLLGYTWNIENGEGLLNYKSLSNFRIYAKALDPTPPPSHNNQPGGGVEVLVKMAGDREYKCVLDADSVMSRTTVLRQLNRSFPDVMFLAPGLREDDWEYFMDETMGDLLASRSWPPSSWKVCLILFVFMHLLTLNPYQSYYRATRGVKDFESQDGSCMWIQ